MIDNLQLQDICLKIVDCEHKTAPIQKIGIPSIRTPNIGKGRLLLDGVNRVSEETWEQWTKREVPRHLDLILAREAPVGNVAIVPKNMKLCLGQRTVLIRPNPEVVNSVFLCYFLLSPEAQHSLHSRGGGSTVSHLNVKEIRQLPVTLPELQTQRKIAAILSAYDDLIENNLQRIKLLEEMVQITYEEWFVRMKFPGHETAQWDKETGLPEGWVKQKLGEVCTLIMGQSPQSEFYNNEKNGLPFHQGVSDYGYRFPTNTCWTTEGVRLAETGDILFSVRAPVGRLNIAREKMVLGRGLSAIRHNFGSQSFLYYQLRQVFFKEDMMGGGAIFASVTKNDMLGIGLIFPSKIIQNKFNDLSVKIDSSILTLTKQNELLREARDILLPRLMTGVIDVDQVEVPEALLARVA
jgi:type I restriction enzyme S subunit